MIFRIRVGGIVRMRRRKTARLDVAFGSSFQAAHRQRARMVLSVKLEILAKLEESAASVLCHDLSRHNSSVK